MSRFCVTVIVSLYLERRKYALIVVLAVSLQQLLNEENFSILKQCQS